MLKSPSVTRQHKPSFLSGARSGADDAAINGFLMGEVIVDTVSSPLGRVDEYIIPPPYIARHLSHCFVLFPAYRQVRVIKLFPLVYALCMHWRILIPRHHLAASCLHAAVLLKLAV